jgi:adsorption protein B
MKELGMKQVFAKYCVFRNVIRRHWLTGREHEVKVREFVAIREYFPSSFGTAVRQKGRWVLGITLQGWNSLRWRGGFSTKYMLYRDRRALVTNFCNVLAYVVVLGVVALWVVNELDPQSLHYPPVIEEGTWLWNLTLANAALLAWRAFHRALFVQRLYGWTQAFWSIPRMVWGNFINFAATGRAVRLYLRFLRTGKLIAWDKTTHTFPSEEDLPDAQPLVDQPLFERPLVPADPLGLTPAVQKQGPTKLALVAQVGALVQKEFDQVDTEPQGFASPQHS